MNMFHSFLYLCRIVKNNIPGLYNLVVHPDSPTRLRISVTHEDTFLSASIQLVAVCFLHIDRNLGAKDMESVRLWFKAVQSLVGGNAWKESTVKQSVVNVTCTQYCFSP
jgi:hypothetical protein